MGLLIRSCAWSFSLCTCIEKQTSPLLPPPPPPPFEYVQPLHSRVPHGGAWLSNFITHSFSYQSWTNNNEGETRHFVGTFEGSIPPQLPNFFPHRAFSIQSLGVGGGGGAGFQDRISSSWIHSRLLRTHHTKKIKKLRNHRPKHLHLAVDRSSRADPNIFDGATCQLT